MFAEKELNYQNKKIKIHYSIIELEDKQLIFGYSEGKEISFHYTHDINLKATKFVLENLNLDSKNILKPTTEHGDKIELNNDILPCDGVITTNNQTLLMSPADCVIFAGIDVSSGNYGICHSGRKGVALNIAENFINKFEEVSEKTLNMQLFLAPHIFGDDYPHENDMFAKENEDKNWWLKHPEFYKREGSKIFYPEIGKSVRYQLEESLKNKNAMYQIITSGKNTYTENFHSNSRDTKENKENSKLRNLVFIGKILN